MKLVLSVLHVGLNMNTRDKHLIELMKKRKFNHNLITFKTLREFIIDECCEELSKYAFTSHSYIVLHKLKEK